ncbi:hypothetical protein [Gorillibacterium sp. CAU 1737]|uniref:hypothetical protein n=1 Tax=Gorillibacterium sp. CAU 1737 TaxID=3140362 RepID=UPI003260CB09
MSEIAEKQARKEQLEAELEREQFNGAIDPNRIRELQDSINLLSNQISELQESEKQQAQEERITATTQASIAGIADIMIGGIQLSAIIGDKDSYEIVKFELEQRLAAQAEEFKSIIDEIRMNSEEKIRLMELVCSEYDSKIAKLKLELNGSEASVDELKEYRDKYYDEANLRKDAEAKRDAAVAIMEAGQEEIDKLRRENEDLRRKLISGATYKPAEQTAEQADRIERLKRERFTVYDLKPDNEFNPKNYTAKLALTGEEVAFGWTALKSYTVIDESEVPQFRQAHGATTTPQEPVDVANGTGKEDIQASVEVPQFPASQVDGAPVDGVDQHEAVQADVGTSVEERLAALEVAVFGKAKVA